LEIQTAARYTAITALVAHYWPNHGEHGHHFLLTLSGALLRVLDRHIAKKIVMEAARIAGYLRARESDIEDTASKLAEGGPVTGWPELREFLDEKIVEQLGKWVGKQEACTPEPPVPYDCLTCETFLQEKRAPMKPLIGEILHAKEVVALVARRRNGKTTLLTDMLAAAAEGSQEWLGFAISEPLRSLYVYLEDLPEQLTQNIRCRITDSQGRFWLLHREHFRQTNWAIKEKPTTFMDRMRATVETLQPNILVLDTLPCSWKETSTTLNAS
jgi:hypothetical protein